MRTEEALHALDQLHALKHRTMLHNFTFESLGGKNTLEGILHARFHRWWDTWIVPELTRLEELVQGERSEDVMLAPPAHHPPVAPPVAPGPAPVAPQQARTEENSSPPAGTGPEQAEARLIATFYHHDGRESDLFFVREESVYILHDRHRRSTLSLAIFFHFPTWQEVEDVRNKREQET